MAQQREADGTAHGPATYGRPVDRPSDQRTNQWNLTVELAEVKAAVHGAAPGGVFDHVDQPAVLQALATQRHGGAYGGTDAIEPRFVETELCRWQKADGQWSVAVRCIHPRH